MKKLFTSTLLTAVAVPFLMAAPTAAKKVQNQPQASNQAQTTTVAKSKVHKKQTKKAQKNTSSTVENNAAPSTPAPKK